MPFSAATLYSSLTSMFLKYISEQSMEFQPGFE